MLTNELKLKTVHFFVLCRTLWLEILQVHEHNCSFNSRIKSKGIQFQTSILEALEIKIRPKSPFNSEVQVATHAEGQKKEPLEGLPLDSSPYLKSTKIWRTQAQGIKDRRKPR